MKVIAKTVFFDNNGIHKKGDVVEVESFDASRMELVEEKKVEKKTRAKSKE